MPRNSQGLYTLPAGNPVVPNTLIEANWANPTMDDIAAALTGSLPRDGSAPMTGPLTLACGLPTATRHADQQRLRGSVPRLRHWDAHRRSGRLCWCQRAPGATSSVTGRRSAARPTPPCSPPSGRPMVRATPARRSTCRTCATSSSVARAMRVPSATSRQHRSPATPTRPAIRAMAHVESVRGSAQCIPTGAHNHAVNDPGHIHGMRAVE